MTVSRPIKVMISSRCLDQIKRRDGGSVPMTELRAAIRKRVEAETLAGEAIFRVETTPDHPSSGISDSFWEESLRLVREADIVLILYTGDAGYSRGRDDLGICEAEFNEAFASGGQRVQLIEILGVAPSKDAARQKNSQRFAELKKQQGAPQVTAANLEEALDKACEAVQEKVLVLVARGSAVVKAGKADSGSSLHWSQLSFQARKTRMESELAGALDGKRVSSRSAELGSEAGIAVIHPFLDGQVLFRCHAIPGAFSVAAARELIGRPFLTDHRYVASLQGGVAGPIHLIACQKGVTEKQATDLLGFPDATVVKSSFGVYVADSAQKIQMALLANCHNPTQTSNAYGLFDDWMERSRLRPSIHELAQARARIVAAIAAERHEQQLETVAARGSTESAGAGPRRKGSARQPRR